MRVLEIRPARVQAKLVEVGDMLVTSPHSGEAYEREPHWIGRVVDQIAVNHAGRHCQWRIERPDGMFIESSPVPPEAFVWVHLPSAPEPIVSYPADLMDAPAGPLGGGLGS